MSHRRFTILFVAAFLMLVSGAAHAQTGDGSLRGYVRDEQGGALPGATVTATSPVLLRAVTSTTDAEGYFRILNLPPGDYTLTVELTGFATTRREGSCFAAAPITRWTSA
jgi:hypothetical protein